MVPDVVRHLAYLFKASGKARPVVLLGAGASFRSGIPLADECVRRIARSAYARHKLGLSVYDSRIVLSDWLPFLRNQDWFIKDPLRFAENFPFAVENFLTPREVRRSFFQEVIQSSHGPSEGYKSLARMMVRRLVGTVLTTNFESLIAEALREQNPKPPSIMEIKTPADLAAFGLNNDFQIVHLHGSVEHYLDQNLQKETKRLNESLVQKIRPLLNDSPVIVIGYRGAEPSIMRHLFEEGIQESQGYKCGVYWCIRTGEKPHDNVKRLRDKLKTNFSLVEIAGFDELVTALDKELAEVSWYTGPTRTLPPPLSLDHRFDLQPLDSVTLLDLDHDLVLSTFSRYCQRLGLPEINRENYLVFLERQGFVHRREDELVPSVGCFLLFGVDVQKRFPYACVTFTQNDKNRTVINGNLVSQFRNILDLLSAEEVNPRIRLKTDRLAEEQDAYPVRALTELTVNLLVHRDYAAHDYSRIEFTRGRSLLFENPGGLMPSIRNGVHLDDKGKFKPVRGLTEMRNPLLADVFFGVGSMDKEGSGLADVSDLALESGGKAEYEVGKDNQSLRVAIWQPVQEAPGRLRVARPVARTELYITNLLPFRILPKAVYLLPLRQNYVDIETRLLFDSNEVPKEVPLFIKHSGCLWSFANFKDFASFADNKGFIERVEQRSCDDLIKNPDSRVLFVWLLNKHWEFFLYNWPLIVEYHRKRAFFRLVGRDSTSITYLSKMNRKTTRDVVKKRGEEPHIWFEHEAIRYATTEYFGGWALELRPTYVFTRSDGETPLGALAQTRRSTRRMKYDRNPAVDNDLVFWARYLSQAQPTINIGNVGVSDLILDSEYLSAEVPKSGEEGAFEAAN